MNTDEPAQQACSSTNVCLPHYLVDNLHVKQFDATMNCRLEHGLDMTVEQYFDSAAKPNKVLIDARALSPVAHEQMMSAYLSDK